MPSRPSLFMAHDRRPAMRRLRSEPRIVLDRATARRLDHDGHLFVSDNVLSASVVSPYLGEEIPDYEALGLKAGTVYYLLRDPKELAKAAASFDGKPLLLRHRPVTADDHIHKIVAGAVSNPTFDASSGQLRGDLSIWDGDAIRAIQDGSNCQLSCGYYFEADMSPGTYRGERYDGVMRGIKANHVSLVPEGRVPGAAVGDASIKQRRLFMAQDDDDSRSKLLEFLAGKLNGADLLSAIKIIDGVSDEDADPDDGEARMQAADRRRQASDAKLKVMKSDAERRTRLFPHANRLGASWR
jgi:hypothetical protein